MKKMLVLVAAVVMVMSYGLTAFAADSPSGDTHEPEPTPVETVSPKTGEDDMLLYTGFSAAALAAIAAVAVKKTRLQ